MIEVDLTKLNVEQQYEIAKSLAANCGYQLVAEDVDTQRVAEIKALIAELKIPNRVHIIRYNHHCNFIIEGLEGLLK